MTDKTDLVTIAVVTRTPQKLKGVLKTFFRIDAREGAIAQEVTVPIDKANLLIRFINKFGSEVLVLEVIEVIEVYED
jgi:hypothetical protein